MKHSKLMTKRPVFNADNVATICGVTGAQVTRWIKGGVLVAYRVSPYARGIRVTRQALTQFLKSNGMEDRLPLIEGAKHESEQQRR
ncbi:MAG: hypothetical protein IT429_22720 [Gemmataceae bacterium]|nr:hypothetical protein [Gemmataceae bacterium]